MVSADIEISELKYRIGRAALEIKSLQKRIETKKKHKHFREAEEYEINGEIKAKEAEIKRLENEIRKIENQAARESNFAGSGEDLEF